MEIYGEPKARRIEPDNLGGMIIAQGRTKTVAKVFNGMARVMGVWEKEGAMREFLERVEEDISFKAEDMFSTMAAVLREKRSR